MSSLLCLTQRYIAVAIGNTLNVFCRNTAKLLFKYECNANENQKENKKDNEETKNNGKNDNECILITHIKYSLKHDCFIIVTDNKCIRTLIHNKDDNCSSLYN